MLFNTYGFIFIFLPIALGIYLYLRRYNKQRLLVGWITLCSLIFYAGWDPRYLLLLLFSIVVNFTVGMHLAQTEDNYARKRILLWVGILFNLSLLGIYKYTVFALYNINLISNMSIDIPEIIMPLGISFFTFTQLAYIVDTYHDKIKDYNFLDYLCFVTFFPHLIAGPIYHHQEIMPQLKTVSTRKFEYADLALGLTFFIIGLAKKTLLADQLAQMATPEFNLLATNPARVSCFTAWIGALSYTFQLYFDFSGYCDMAIGLGRLFGIRLPLNFNSPYQAVNISDFWHRWHITLSRFLRDYLYIPLGGNRKGEVRRYINLLITMLLGGLWHGASWTFVVWGALHGSYLTLNHFWLSVKSNFSVIEYCPRHIRHASSVAFTFVLVIIAWVFFRAESVPVALTMLSKMIGADELIQAGDLSFYMNNYRFYILLISFVIVWSMPNTQQFTAEYKPALETYPNEVKNYFCKRCLWQPIKRWAFILCIMGLMAILSLGQVSEFIYYQF